MEGKTLKRLYDISDFELYKLAENIINDINNESNERKRVTKSQLKSLENICNSAQSINEIKNFIDHQIERKIYLAFYQRLKKEINETIQNLVKQFPNEDKKEVEYFLVKELIQHLIAENMYQAKINENNNQNLNKGGKKNDYRNR